MARARRHVEHGVRPLTVPQVGTRRPPDRTGALLDVDTHPARPEVEQPELFVHPHRVPGREIRERLVVPEHRLGTRVPAGQVVHRDGLAGRRADDPVPPAPRGFEHEGELDEVDVVPPAVLPTGARPASAPRRFCPPRGHGVLPA